jgi:2'-5' RNA ligase
MQARVRLAMIHHGVILCYDPEAEAAMCQVRAQVRNVTGNTFLIDQGAPPHVTLGIYDGAEGADPAALEQTMRGLEVHPLELQFASVASFQGDGGVLFCAPVVRTELLDLHRRWHEAAPGSHVRYLPGVWVPHATVGFQLDDDQLKAGFEVARRALPIPARVESILLVAFEMGTAKLIERVAELRLS